MLTSKPSRTVALFLGLLVPACTTADSTVGEQSSAESAGLSPIDLPADPATAAWVAAQNARSRAYLATDGPFQSAVKARAAELLPGNATVKTSFFGTDYYVSRGSLFSVGQPGAPDRLLVDAAALPPGSAVTEFRVSPDQQKLAYGYQINGSDWTTWNVVGLADLVALAGPFFIKSSGVDEMNWATDSQGLFYEGWLTVADDFQGRRQPQIRFHRLGDDTANDTVVFEDSELPHTIKYNALPLDANTVIVYRVLGGAEVPLAVYLAKRTADGRPWCSVTVMRPTHTWGRFVGTSGRKLLLRTSQRFGRYGIVSVDADTLATRVVVPEHAHNVLIQAQQIGDKLVLQYLDGELRNSIVVTSLSGAVQTVFHPHDLGLPDIGALGLLTGNFQSTAGYFTYSSVTMPTETLRFDVASSAIAKLPGRQVNFDGSRVKLETRSYTTSDGSSIPIQVFSRTDIAAPAFAYLLVYGNIGVANLANYNRKFQLMLELGGMVAIANARGGGELGLSWQLPGVFDKWRTLDDIAHASRWLKATYPSIGDRVALSGRSYGGMMTMTEYAHFQDDFRVFTPVVGVSDPVALLNQEVGWVYGDDLGYPRDFRGYIAPWPRSDRMLLSYSPLLAVPALAHARPIMAFSAQYDTRVTSSQTIRFIRALEQQFGDAAPVYLIEHENVGHNGRAEVADEAVFIAKQLGISTLAPLKITP